MGVVLVVVELNRKNKDDIVKKEKEAAEKQEIKELHDRHLSTEKVGLPPGSNGWVVEWVGRRPSDGWLDGGCGAWPVARPEPLPVTQVCPADVPALLSPPCPARVCLQEIREQMRTLAKQLHQVDERLQYMEQAMGRKRSWLPLFGG
jgi:hypothetical protein